MTCTRGSKSTAQVCSNTTASFSQILTLPVTALRVLKKREQLLLRTSATWEVNTAHCKSSLLQSKWGIILCIMEHSHRLVFWILMFLFLWAIWGAKSFVSSNVIEIFLHTFKDGKWKELISKVNFVYIPAARTKHNTENFFGMTLCASFQKLTWQSILFSGFSWGCVKAKGSLGKWSAMLERRPSAGKGRSW